MSQSVIFLSVIFLAPVELPTAACAPEQAAAFSPIPRYRRPPLPAGGDGYPAAPCESGIVPAGGVIWHTVQKVGQPGNPVIHTEVDTMEFRPSDALPGDAGSRVW
jgi:hypothetical protein